MPFGSINDLNRPDVFSNDAPYDAILNITHIHALNHASKNCCSVLYGLKHPGA